MNLTRSNAVLLKMAAMAVLLLLVALTVVLAVNRLSSPFEETMIASKVLAS